MSVADIHISEIGWGEDDGESYVLLPRDSTTPITFGEPSGTLIIPPSVVITVRRVYFYCMSFW